MGGSVLSLPRPLHFSHLVPLRKRRKKCTWLSSVSLASLQLLESSCEEGAILTVFLGEKMTEEHFISKLHFTWPHVSCMSRFPARGSRAVFVSYRDCAEEPALHENESLSPPVASEISSNSAFVPSDSPLDRCQEKLDDVPAFMQEPEVCQEERAIHSQDDEVPLAVVYPRSFSSLLPSCQSEAEKMKIQSTCSSLDPSLRSQIMMYMEDSAFQEMLMTVDRVMEELEADSPLQSNKLQQITW